VPSARERRRVHLDYPHAHIAYAISARIQVIGETRRVSTPGLPTGGTVEWTAHVCQFSGIGVKWNLEYVPEQAATSTAAAPDVLDPFWRPGDLGLRDGRLLTHGSALNTRSSPHGRPIPAGKESFAVRNEPPGTHSTLGYVVVRAPLATQPALEDPAARAAVFAASPPLAPTRTPAATIRPPTPRRGPRQLELPRAYAAS
jgi:hypothetical protein